MRAKWAGNINRRSAGRVIVYKGMVDLEEMILKGKELKRMLHIRGLAEVFNKSRIIIGSSGDRQVRRDTKMKEVVNEIY